MMAIGLMLGAFSFLAAFLLVSAVKLIWKIDSANKAIWFMAGIFVLANILCYKASSFLLKANADKSLYSKKIMIVGGPVILLMSLLIGLIVVMSVS